MKVLIFDTETTGLPKGNPSQNEIEKWPYIVQLSYILYDISKHKVLVSHDHIIKLGDNVEISKKSEEMHGISKERSQNEGIDIELALDLFNICLQNTNILVAHNISFDKSMLLAEAIRNNMNISFSKFKYLEYCTMKRSVELCNIETLHKASGRTYIKYPTLSELHKKLFKTIPQGTHNSFIDILICMRCFYKMMFDEDVCKHSKKINKQMKTLCKL